MPKKSSLDKWVYFYYLYIYAGVWLNTRKNLLLYKTFCIIAQNLIYQDILWDLIEIGLKLYILDIRLCNV